VTLLCRCSCRW